LFLFHFHQAHRLAPEDFRLAKLVTDCSHLMLWQRSPKL
jgi:hypothetical protein